MSTADNETIIRRFIEEFWNQRKFDLADELIHADHFSSSLALLPRGPEGIKLIGRIVTDIFPDLHRTIQDIFAAGDKVAARWDNSGTHQGTYMNVPGTGKHVTWTELCIAQIKDGKIVESWYRPDELGLLKELAPDELAWIHL